MTTLEPKHERLLSYLDGELEADARAEFEAELASDAALRDELAEHERLRGLLAEAPAAFSVDGPGDLAFERVRQSIHDALAPAPAAAKAPSARAPSAKVVAIGSARRSRRVFFGAIVAVAAAAAVFVVAFGDPPSSGQAATDRLPGTPDAPALNGTEIVRVEFGKMSGTYWEQNEGEQRVAVVWIDDTFPEEVGRP